MRSFPALTFAIGSASCAVNGAAVSAAIAIRPTIDFIDLTPLLATPAAKREPCQSAVSLIAMGGQRGSLMGRAAPRLQSPARRVQWRPAILVPHIGLCTVPQTSLHEPGVAVSERARGVPVPKAGLRRRDRWRMQLTTQNPRDHEVVDRNVIAQRSEAF